MKKTENYKGKRMSANLRRAFYESTYPRYILKKNKIKQRSKTIIQKEDSLPQGCS